MHTEELVGSVEFQIPGLDLASNPKELVALSRLAKIFNGLLLLGLLMKGSIPLSKTGVSGNCCAVSNFSLNEASNLGTPFSNRKQIVKFSILVVIGTWSKKLLGIARNHPSRIIIRHVPVHLFHGRDRLVDGSLQPGQIEA